MKFFGSATPVRAAIPVRAGGVTNTEPACTTVRGILPSATPVRKSCPDTQPATLTHGHPYI
ncbi:MAG: hypothetical protein QM324_03425 [Bacteroidota bacterium]|jgi:hypothetical protein|nr:hypothetical protein [Bacteroidota bacterium]